MLKTGLSVINLIRKNVRQTINSFVKLLVDADIVNNYRLNIEYAANNSFGDYSTNFFLINNISKSLCEKYAPRIVNALKKRKQLFSNVEYTNGYLNFFLNQKTFAKYLIKNHHRDFSF
jgi:arginyl-tRNA synthetase